MNKGRDFMFCYGLGIVLTSIVFATALVVSLADCWLRFLGPFRLPACDAMTAFLAYCACCILMGGALYVSYLVLCSIMSTIQYLQVHCKAWVSQTQKHEL